VGGTDRGKHSGLLVYEINNGLNKFYRTGRSLEKSFLKNE